MCANDLVSTNNCFTSLTLYVEGLLQYCIKSIYNGFAIATDCALKVVSFGFFSVKIMPHFRISFWLLRRSDKHLFLGSIHFQESPCDNGEVRVSYHG